MTTVACAPSWPTCAPEGDWTPTVSLAIGHLPSPRALAGDSALQPGRLSVRALHLRAPSRLMPAHTAIVRTRSGSATRGGVAWGDTKVEQTAAHTSPVAPDDTE